MKPLKRTTIYDIAKHLHITPATVSRALNDNKFISQATKQLVATTAKQLNYKPNTNASNLRTGGSKTIGVIVPQININFFSNVIAGIEEVARSYHYNTIICQSNDEFEREQESIETLINQNVAGIMLSLAANTKKYLHLAEALKHNIHLIQFDRTEAKLPTDRVVNEVNNIVHKMIEHLFQQGYRNIAFLVGPQNIDIFSKRRKAFEKSTKQLGLSFNTKNIQEYDLTRASAKEAAQVLLSRKNKPDAIFASSGFGELGAWEVAKEMGIKVPEELGICGFSNEFYTEIITPSITTINQFSLQMGQTVGKLFFESLHTEKQNYQPQTVVINPELIIRESTNRGK